MSHNNVSLVVRPNNTDLMKKTESVVMTTPLADIYETADAFVVKLDMPGATKESISITLDASSLVVRSVAEAQSRENTNLLYGECGGGNYHRSFNLTNGVNRENVEAQYDNGVLTLKLFKKEELKLREIRIN